MGSIPVFQPLASHSARPTAAPLRQRLTANCASPCLTNTLQQRRKTDGDSTDQRTSHFQLHTLGFPSLLKRVTNTISPPNCPQRSHFPLSKSKARKAATENNQLLHNSTLLKRQTKASTDTEIKNEKLEVGKSRITKQIIRV